MNLERRVGALLGASVATLDPVAGGGYTQALRLRATLADGRAAFVKAANDELTAGWLRDEHKVYSQVEGSFLPQLLAYEDGVLVLEDLSAGHWPPPWPDGAVEAVLAALAELAAVPPPDGIPPIESIREELTDGWARVEADPGPFLSLGVASPAWLEEALPALREAAETAPLAGESLLHLDVRSDNICLVDGRAVLVDWNWAVVGNPLLDAAAWLPSLHLEGGPAPEDVLPDCPPGFAALMAGFFAARAGTAPPATALAHVRELQLGQLRVALPWAARAVGLPPVA